tara:strand:+ start:358 stop:579 length:222 start_codon:yes stop_codon:yes gene_type:complete
MDIWFINSNDRVHVRAASVHGMLWLQTHFESNHWEAIASEQVTLNKNNAQMLVQDAKQAGLIINSVPEIAYSI